MDQRGFDNQRRDTLTSREAAQILGVKLETLYAYKSRGLLISVPVEGSRARRFLRADVERLKQRHDARAGHTAVAANALRWGEPVLDTGITRIDAAGPHYRGHSAIALAAEGVPFESVATLLWSGSLPPSPPAFAARGLRLPIGKLRALLPADASPLTAMTLSVAALGARSSTEEPGQLIRQLVASIPLAADPGRMKLALREPGIASALLVAFGARPRIEAQRLMNMALVLCADHELNPSSFAARLAASTGAGLHACISAALAVFSGPEHGGQCTRLEHLVDAALRTRDPAGFVRRKVAEGEEIPGFRQPLYPAGDPRAAALIAASARVGRKSARARALATIISTLAENGFGYPTIDVGIISATYSLGMGAGAPSAIFAVGRSAGWIAHVMEQRAAGYVLRPRARFVGPDPATAK
jgi:citrate synthase